LKEINVSNEIFYEKGVKGKTTCFRVTITSNDGFDREELRSIFHVYIELIEGNEKREILLNKTEMNTDEICLDNIEKFFN
jgi:hypothetical protein